MPANSHKSRHPALSRVIERNIRTIIRLRRETAAARSRQDRIADAITDFSGSMPFVYLHVAWFAGWVALNTGRFGFPPFDPFPYGLLTMIVSLEAIFLSALVMITQNRMSEEVDRRADLDLQIGLLTEHEITRALQMLAAIQIKLGIEEKAPGELTDLERETRPEDVMAEIERLRSEARPGNEPR